MKSGRWKPLLFVFLWGICLAFVGYRLSKAQTSDRFMNSKMNAPNFSFQDQTGKLFSSDQLKGKVWVADFIFTRCQGQCPMLSQWFRVLENDWKNNPDFKLVSFTVDPQYDSVEVFKDYANDLQADNNQWHFLTGPKSKIYPVIQDGFHLTAEKDPQGIPGFEFIHTTRLVLVDGNGDIRGMYDGQQSEEVQKLIKDIKYLLNSRTRS